MIANVEQAIREYLPRTFHLSLATSSGNAPWVSEVHFVYDDELNIYFRSLPSRRHSIEIAANPKVAGNIVVQHELGKPVRGIYFEGEACKLTELSEREAAYPFFQERFGMDRAILDEAASEAGHQFYKISVKKYYVFDSVESKPSQKYELEWNAK